MGIQSHGALLEIDRSVSATWYPVSQAASSFFSATAFVGILSTPSTKRTPTPFIEPIEDLTSTAPCE